MPGHDHSFISKLIHKIALQYAAVAELSFDIENAAVKKKVEMPGDHVFISGLARSGTTVLLNYLYQTGGFKSLTYADMPFVLMPNTWQKISGRKASTTQQERAHKDGILIGPDSPEAFEEVFWRVFCGTDYIKADKLLVHKVDADISQKFKAYINNVSGGVAGKRYLSKNNNNILRLDYLQKAFPNAFIIVPFRDPLQHAASLLNQHNHFTTIHQTDKFALNYMNWLGHFEFGMNQKPFSLGDESADEQMRRYSKTDINFWLLTWRNYYGYIRTNVPDSTILFDYERFCAYPGGMLSALFAEINLNVPVPAVAPFIPLIKEVAAVDEQLLQECTVIYADLLRKAVAQPGY
jgi:hypothetical protein